MGNLLDFLFGDEEDAPTTSAYTIDTSNIEAARAERQAALEAAGWTDGHQRRLVDYCDVFEIPSSLTEDYPFVCMQVLATMFVIPTHDDEGVRYSAANELRQVMAEAFGLTARSAMSGVEPIHQFYRRVNMVLTNMQVLPQWWSTLSASPEELVKLHKSLRKTIWVLKKLGAGGAFAGGGALAADAAVAGYDKFGNSSGNTIRRTGEALQAAGKKTVDTVTGRTSGLSKLGRGGLVGAVLIVTGVALYAAAQERIEMVEDLLEIAYREGRATEAQYLSMFEKLDPDQVNLEKYWD